MKVTVTPKIALLSSLFLLSLIVGYTFWDHYSYEFSEKQAFELPESELSPVEKKAARAEYFFRLLRDPEINAIPPNIRARELNFAKRLPSRDQFPLQMQSAGGTNRTLQFNWQSVGPTDLGGRTRALGIDQRDSDIMIAGGVSGGIWKSIDGGATWQLKTDPQQNLSVTSLAQDPTNPDTWYYTTGEFLGNSASDRGFRAFYYGTGVFRSDDNGETWSRISNTRDTDTSFNSPYDFITRVEVSPTTGSVFIASNGSGIYRSPFPLDAGATPPPLLGTVAGHLYADIDIASNGHLVAVLSSVDAGESNNDPGIFFSDDNGDSWTEITPSSFPSTHRRSVVTFAPSDPDIIYVFTLKGEGDTSNQGVSFFKIDLSGGLPGTAEDRSANLPDFGDPVGDMETQGGYNMLVSVKPDDPDFVMVGAINLFRSTDGFATGPSGSSSTEKDQFWIGGYAKANNISIYPNQHPDQHVIAYDPNNPNRVWAGHDGGLSVTSDVTASSVSWNDRDNEYVTSQFYTVAIPDEPGDERVMGGTQDNGTPFFRFDTQQSQPTVSGDISSGDGSYAYFSPSFLFVSRQRGSIIRFDEQANGDPNNPVFVHPLGASNQLFVHPYVVDPNDENIMYYPDGTSMWRNTQIASITSQDGSSSGTTTGWENFPAVTNPTGYTISALNVSNVPSDILYFAASSDNSQPRLFKLLNASTGSSGDIQELPFPDDPDLAGAYVHNISINPANANEAVAVISNYDVPSIYQTGDGGTTWQSIEGNLAGDALNPGPSIRSATIIPAEGGTIYLVGTSTGIYSTSNLDGANTQWVQESPNDLGFAVSEFVTSRISDGNVAVGTHGRGIYLGSFQGTITNIPSITLGTTEARTGDEITINAVNFTFDTGITDSDVTFNDVPGSVTNVTPSQLTVEVPRVPRSPETTTDFVQVRVSSGGQVLSNTLELLPPLNFALQQNFPNPFNPSTTIPFDLSKRSGVIVQVYNISGQKILERRVSSTVLEPRSYNFQIDLSGFASGVYFYRIVAIPSDGSDLLIKSKKMTLIR